MENNKNAYIHKKPKKVTYHADRRIKKKMDFVEGNLIEIGSYPKSHNFIVGMKAAPST